MFARSGRQFVAVRDWWHRRGAHLGGDRPAAASLDVLVDVGRVLGVQCFIYAGARLYGRAAQHIIYISRRRIRNHVETTI